jgi:hypothetical protein
VPVFALEDVLSIQQPLHLDEATMSDEDKQREIAKKKRICMEVAAQIHDIVEENLWTDFEQLPVLSEKLVILVKDYKVANAGL